MACVQNSDMNILPVSTSNFFFYQMCFSDADVYYTYVHPITRLKEFMKCMECGVINCKLLINWEMHECKTHDLWMTFQALVSKYDDQKAWNHWYSFLGPCIHVAQTNI